MRSAKPGNHLNLQSKDPNVRSSTHNSLGNSFQSFAPVNDWPILDFTLDR